MLSSRLLRNGNLQVVVEAFREVERVLDPCPVCRRVERVHSKDAQQIVAKCPCNVMEVHAAECPGGKSQVYPRLILKWNSYCARMRKALGESSSELMARTS